MAITYIGERFNTSQGGALAPAFHPASALTAGDLAILTFVHSGGASYALGGVTDSKSNTWTVDAHVAVSTSLGVAICSSLLTAGLAATDTVTIGGSGTGGVFGTLLEEFSGAAASPRDQTGTASGSGTGSGTVTTTGATGQASEIAVAAFANNASQTVTLGGGYGGFTTTDIAASKSIGAGYLPLSATGVQTATGTWTSTIWAAAIATYKAQTAGPPADPARPGGSAAILVSVLNP